MNPYRIPWKIDEEVELQSLAEKNRDSWASIANILNANFGNKRTPVACKTRAKLLQVNRPVSEKYRTLDDVKEYVVSHPDLSIRELAAATGVGLHYIRIAVRQVRTELLQPDDVCEDR